MTYEQAVARAFLNVLGWPMKRRVFFTELGRTHGVYALRRLRVRAGLVP